MCMKTAARLLLLALPTAVGVDIPAWAKGLNVRAKAKEYQECLATASSKFIAAHAKDTECPADCLACVKKPLTCVSTCKLKNACSCGAAMPAYVQELQACCSMFDLGYSVGKPACVKAMEKLSLKAMAGINYQCKTMEAIDETGCQQNTGGTCGYLACAASRASTCDTHTYTCRCKPNECSAGGACVPRPGTEAGGAVSLFGEFAGEIQLATKIDTFAPLFAEQCATLDEADRLAALNNNQIVHYSNLQISLAGFIGAIAGACLTYSVFGRQSAKEHRVVLLA